ncbi:endothelin-converting enzyme [Aspergillus sclerotialis]|uniref:Endothelin-converting enzyme n=1 Tax=Aspergillus sclerotialis TaxID=2070753 RepID=A0A3A2ZIF1_9EURO|nr:endothelin-converting enzyme [Aspergillus sclerotialis]
MFYLFLFLTTFINALASNSPADGCETPQPQAPPLCETPECIHAASNILYNLHPNYTNIDPCTDFHQYACGGWDELHDMRPDQSSISTLSIVSEDNQSRLRHILESSEAPDPSDSENFQKLKAAYNACLDESAIKKRGTKPLDDMLAELEKIYPASSGKDVKEGLTDAMIYLMGINTEALVAASIGPDDRDPDNVTIFVTPPSEIGLPARENYNNTDMVAEYTEVAKKVLGDFSNNESTDLADDVVKFETKLASVTPDTESQQNVTKYYNPLSINETLSLLPDISFAGIISNFAPSGYKGNRLIVISPSYMKSLSEILSQTPRETVQLFLKWKIIQSWVNVIEDPKVEALRRFNNKVAGKQPDAKEDRWRTCVKRLDNNLSWILSRFYILDAFSTGSKELGDKIVTDIRERFVFTLAQTSWMSQDVRKLAIEKVENIVQKIGYPTKSPNIMDATEVNKYYESLKISNETFFENTLAASKFDLNKEWSQLGKPTDRAKWEMTAPTVNAYYSPSGNEIVFPAGIMQSPVFYGSSAPLYLAYGSFGAVSGHELSHAFDSSGRRYDQTGNYTDWWDEKTTKAFEERTQCFVDQYSKFNVTGPNSEVLHVNGLLTLGENIADAGGLGAAFHAWKKRDEASPDAHLPGLSSFSKEQLFFISFGNVWCSKISKEMAERRIYTDPHAPDAARILGTTANSREFKEAFNCPTKQPVCKLW